MPRFQPKRYEQLFAQMIARVVTRGQLSDVGDSAFVKHICAAMARSMDELYYQTTLLRDSFSIDQAVGPDLDARAAEIQPGDITRLPAVAAAGNVTFTTTGAVTIPANTQIKTAGGIVFMTTALASTGVAGAVSAPIVAVLPGSAGNVVANSIVSFVQKPAGVLTVANQAATTAGQDGETDDAFRARLKQYVGSLARSTVTALESCVLGLQDPTTNASIRFSSVVQDPANPGNVILYIDDGTGDAQSIESLVNEIVTAGISGGDVAVGGETRLYLDHKPIDTITPFTLVSSTRYDLVAGRDYTLDSTNGLLVFTPALAAGERIIASYTYYTGLIALAQKVVDGDPDNRTAYPGYRAAGVRVVVTTPSINLININATLTVADGYNTSGVEAAVQSALISYINSLSISQDVLVAQLFRVATSVAGVVNVIFNTPTTDTIITDSALARSQPSSVVIN